MSPSPDRGIFDETHQQAKLEALTLSYTERTKPNTTHPQKRVTEPPLPISTIALDPPQYKQTMTSSSATDDSGIRYAMKRRSRRMNRTVAMRGLFALSMMVAIVVCATVAFVMIRNLQEQIGLQTYESIALSALASAKAITNRKLQAGSVMEFMLSNAFPNADDWPMIDLNGYYLISNSIASIASDENTTMQIGLLVVVEPGEEAYVFEKYAKEYYQKQAYPEDAGVKDIGFGIKIRGSNGYEFDRSGNSTTYGSDNRVLTPILDHSTWNSGMLMYNAHHSSTAIDGVLDCVKEHNEEMPQGFSDHDHYGIPCMKPHCGVVSGFRLKNEDLVSLIYTPVFPYNDQTTIVGLVGLTVNFRDVIYSVIPDYFDGIYAVISTRSADSTDHSTVTFDTATYEIVHGIPKLIGQGDLHPTDYSRYGKSIVLNEVNTNAPDAVVYTLTLYPSSFSQYQTTSAAAVAAGLAAVVLACGIAFLMYDSVVRRESNKQKTILSMRRRFVRFISHEIRTPLNTVCMGIELLLDELKSFPGKSPELDRQLDVKSLDSWKDITRDIRDNATGAVRILDDLLNYDKVETNTLHIEANPVKINELVRKTTSRFKVQAVNRQINLDLRIQKGGSSLAVVGDEMRLGEVLSNLISNALKFTSPGGSVQVSMRPCLCCRSQCAGWRAITGTRRVEGSIICERPPMGSVTIEVIDTGAGMTENQIGSIFQEGVQFDANKLQAGGGSGLGLAIAKGIIDRHNGVIRAESEGPGKGSKFVVVLPLFGGCNPSSDFGGRLITCSDTVQTVPLPESEHEDPEHAPTIDEGDSQSEQIASNAVSPLEECYCQPAADLPSETPAQVSSSESVQSDGAPSETNKKHKILVVEDVLASRKMLVRLLERAGHECVIACNGQEAVNKMKEVLQGDMEAGNSGVDTILMDFEMPIQNGPDATQEIRSLGYHGLVFGLTGNLLKEDVDHFLIKGADDVFPKPFNFSLLQDAWAKFS